MSNMHFGSNQQWNNTQFALWAYEPQNDAKSSSCQYISLLMFIFAQQWHSINPCLHRPRFRPSREDQALFPGCKQWLILSARTKSKPMQTMLKRYHPCLICIFGSNQWWNSAQFALWAHKRHHTAMLVLVTKISFLMFTFASMSA